MQRGRALPPPAGWRRTLIFANSKNANKSKCPCQKKTLIVIQSASFSTKQIPCEVCEIRFACEILLRNVKCLRAWVDLFYFT